MRDYWGHPKPGYLAYAATLRCIKDKSLRRRGNDSSVQAYVFAGGGRACLIAWMKNMETRQISIDTLLPEIMSDREITAFDTVGSPVEIANTGLELSFFPTFVYFDTNTTGAPGHAVSGPRQDSERD